MLVIAVIVMLEFEDVVEVISVVEMVVVIVEVVEVMGVAACENPCTSRCKIQRKISKIITGENQFLKRREVWQCPCKCCATGGADVVPCSV